MKIPGPYSHQKLPNKFAVCSYYISPKSHHKQETIEHIIDTIHNLRAIYDHEVSFIIGGDFNRTAVNDILDSYGALHQVIAKPNRRGSMLSLLLTDLQTFYHPATNLPPLKVDEGKKGEDSDHEIIVFAPKNNIRFRKELKRKVVRTRPLPESQIAKFEQAIGQFQWKDELKDKSVNEQVTIFHDVLKTTLDHYFPEKVTKISTLDKRWMDPKLKQLHRQMQREFTRNRKSQRFKMLKSTFKKEKRKSIKNKFDDFVSELKTTNPGKWFSMAKKIGAVNDKDDTVSIWPWNPSENILFQAPPTSKDCNLKHSL